MKLVALSLKDFKCHSGPPSALETWTVDTFSSVFKITTAAGFSWERKGLGLSSQEETGKPNESSHLSRRCSVSSWLVHSPWGFSYSSWCSLREGTLPGMLRGHAVTSPYKVFLGQHVRWEEEGDQQRMRVKRAAREGLSAPSPVFQPQVLLGLRGAVPGPSSWAPCLSFSLPFFFWDKGVLCDTVLSTSNTEIPVCSVTWVAVFLCVLIQWAE